MTPSFAAPGVTHPSDATGPECDGAEFLAVFTTRRYINPRLPYLTLGLIKPSETIPEPLLLLILARSLFCGLLHRVGANSVFSLYCYFFHRLAIYFNSCIVL